MEIALQAATLLLAGNDQLFAAVLQVIGQLSGVDGRPGLPGDIVEQAALGSREGFARRARADDQDADLLRLIDQRELHLVGLGRAEGSHNLSLVSLMRGDSHVGKFQRAADGLNHR